MKSENWAAIATDYVEGIENEAKTDHKKFYNENDGSNRARSAIAKLDALRMRLTPFVRA
jgi:hypothetical protein